MSFPVILGATRQTANSKPPVKGNGTIAPVGIDTQDKATISNGGQIAPVGSSEASKTAKSSERNGKVSVPSGKNDDAISRAIEDLQRLFGTLIFDGDPETNLGGWLREQVRNNPGGEIHFYDPKFRKLLANALGVTPSMISKVAIDYFFGDQKGSLDNNDHMNLAQLIGQLEFLVPLFQTQKESGASSARTYIEADKILIMSYDQYRNSPLQKGIDFRALAKKEDTMYLTFVKAALSEHLQQMRTAGKSERAIQEEEAEYFKRVKAGDVPEDLNPLLFAAYWSNFVDAIKIRHNIDLPVSALAGDPKMLDHLLNGMFKDFVEGHSDKGNPNAITHDLPTSLDSASIEKAFNARAGREVQTNQSAGRVALPSVQR